MKPQRRVISCTHVVAIRLDCGHTVYRTNNPVVGLRLGCDVCEAEAFRRFDLEQAITKAAHQARGERGASGSSELVEVTAADLDSMRKELTKND